MKQYIYSLVMFSYLSGACFCQAQVLKEVVPAPAQILEERVVERTKEVLINLDFPGGTVDDLASLLVKTYQERDYGVLNVVAMEDAKQVTLPSFKVANTSLKQTLWLLEKLSGRTLAFDQPKKKGNLILVSKRNPATEVGHGGVGLGNYHSTLAAHADARAKVAALKAKKAMEHLNELQVRNAHVVTEKALERIREVEAEELALVAAQQFEEVKKALGPNHPKAKAAQKKLKALMKRKEKKRNEAKVLRIYGVSSFINNGLPHSGKYPIFAETKEQKKRIKEKREDANALHIEKQIRALNDLLNVSFDELEEPRPNMKFHGGTGHLR